MCASVCGVVGGGMSSLGSQRLPQLSQQPFALLRALRETMVAIAFNIPDERSFVGD